MIAIAATTSETPPNWSQTIGAEVSKCADLARSATAKCVFNLTTQSVDKTPNAREIEAKTETKKKPPFNLIDRKPDRRTGNNIMLILKSLHHVRFLLIYHKMTKRRGLNAEKGCSPVESHCDRHYLWKDFNSEDPISYKKKKSKKKIFFK